MTRPYRNTVDLGPGGRSRNQQRVPVRTARSSRVRRCRYADVEKTAMDADEMHAGEFPLEALVADRVRSLARIRSQGRVSSVPFSVWTECAIALPRRRFASSSDRNVGASGMSFLRMALT